tara:strand:- start:946 stop:2094 length:1149 start_codon:yes stop_codon:yes gene_type:complete
LLGILLAPLFIVILFVLFIINPFYPVRIGYLRTDRLGHLSLNTELFLRRIQLGLICVDPIHLFICGPSVNYQLLKMIKRHLNILQFNKFTFLVIYQFFQYFRMTKFYIDLPMNSNEFYEFNNTSHQLKFTLDEEKFGRHELNKYGIKLHNDWFACVAARDFTYLENEYPGQKWDYHNYRNADINTFIPAIKYIIDQGGYVFRMGSVTNKKVNFNHKRFIDYSYRDRNDFMDIFLPSKCRFFLGTTGGICDLATTFNIPRASTNVVLWDLPFGVNSIYIPKKIKSRINNKYVTYIDVLNKYDGIYDGKIMQSNGHIFEDNTENEILELVIEIMENLDGKVSVNEEEQSMMENYFSIFTDEMKSFSIKNPIGKEFLKNNQDLFR